MGNADSAGCCTARTSYQSMDSQRDVAAQGEQPQTERCLPANRKAPGRSEEQVRVILERHSVSMLEFGVGGALTLTDLAREVDLGLCQLETSAEDPSEGTGLVRRLALVEVSLRAPAALGGGALVEVEQVLDDGRRRRGRGGLHVKIRRGEEPSEGVERALCERLGLSRRGAAALIAASRAAQQARGEALRLAGTSSPTAQPLVVEAESPSYPSLRSAYTVHMAELRIELAAAPPMEGAEPCDYAAVLGQLGLPKCKEFVTVEGRLGSSAGGRVHHWRWESDAKASLAASEDEGETSSSQDDESQEGEKGSENGDAGVARNIADLRAALRSLEAQKAQPSAGEAPDVAAAELRQPVAKVRAVLNRLATWPTRGVAGPAPCPPHGSKGENRRMSKDLHAFIQSNFEKPEKQLVLAQNKSDEAKVITPRLNDSFSRTSTASVVATEAEKLRESVAASDSYEIDALGLAERTGNRTLLVVGEMLIMPHLEEMGTEDGTMRRFLSTLHRKYRENQNPFHNEAHVACVAHITHWLVSRWTCFSTMPLHERLATELAALCHDVGHFGRTNAFCISTQHRLSLLYNDRSVLENMHASTCFSLMQADECNILKDLLAETRKTFREIILDLILATDMASHFDFLGKLKERNASGQFDPEANAQDRRLMLRACVKAADLGHAALPWDLHEPWVVRLLDEFYAQGEEEANMGMPFSPLCERTGNLAEFRDSQKGFLQFVILPLFKELAAVPLPEVGEKCVARVEVNASSWISRAGSEEIISTIKGTKPTAAQKGRSAAERAEAAATEKEEKEKEKDKGPKRAAEASNGH